MTDPKAKPAPVLTDNELEYIRSAPWKHFDRLKTHGEPLDLIVAVDRNHVLRLLAEHSQLKREVKLLSAVVSAYEARDACTASMPIAAEDRLDAALAALREFDAAKPGAGED